MSSELTPGEAAQLTQTIEMFEVITQSQPHDYQSLEILKEAYLKLNREKDVISTSKRIAQAYVELGQLSSAILEYETVLQRFPNDLDAQHALKAIDNKAGNVAAQPMLTEPAMLKPAAEPARAKKAAVKTPPADADDGRQAMRQVFVDGKIISAGDFDLCWKATDLSAPANGIIEPFIQVLAEKGIMLMDQSLKALADKSRLAFLPLDRYDVDLDLSRKFPADTCKRWCVLPFDRMSKSILVATANPFNKQAVRELAEATSQRLIWYLSSPQDLVKNLQKAFR